MIKTRKKRYIVTLAIVAALLAAFLAYTADYYRADAEAKAAISADEQRRRTTQLIMEEISEASAEAGK